VSDLKKELDKIALDIAAKVQEQDCPFDARLDAFKVLSAYHLGLLRKNAQQPPDKDIKSFGDIVDQIRKADSRRPS
jgi:hypothetical protein